MKQSSFRLSRRHLLAGIPALPLLAQSGYRPELSFIGPPSAAAARAAGFRRVELGAGAFRPQTVEKTDAEFKAAGVQPVSIYVNATFYDDAAARKETVNLTELASVAHPVGVRALTVNPNPKNWEMYAPKTDAELTVQAEGLNRLGESLKRHNVALHLHHHWTEISDNVRELRHLLRNTDPKLVSFCMDVHWVYRGGQDPSTILEEFGPRVGGIHLRNSRQGVIWEDFSEGDIDYRKVARTLRKMRYSGLLTVELWYEKTTKITRPKEADMKLSRAYAEQVFEVAA